MADALERDIELLKRQMVRVMEEQGRSRQAQEDTQVSFLSILDGFATESMRLCTEALDST